MSSLVVARCANGSVGVHTTCSLTLMRSSTQLPPPLAPNVFCSAEWRHGPINSSLNLVAPRPADGGECERVLRLARNDNANALDLRAFSPAFSSAGEGEMEGE